MQSVYTTKGCAARLDGCVVKDWDTKHYADDNAVLPNIIKFRLQERISVDGTCKLLADIYTYKDGHEVEIIFNLEVDGVEYEFHRDHPEPL